MLSHCLFSLFKNSYAGNFCTGLKTTEWSILAGGCGPRTTSFSSVVGDIEHDVEESLEDEAI